MKKEDANKWLRKKGERTAVLRIMTKPMTPTEIGEKIGLKRIRVRGFLEKGIFKCLTPKAKKGRVYGLTEKGQKTAKRLAKDEDRAYSYFELDIDWYSYGWITCSKPVRMIFKAVATGRESVKEIDEYLKAPGRQLILTYSYKYKLLRDLVKKGLLSVSGDKRKLFALTEKGKEIKDVILRE